MKYWNVGVQEVRTERNIGFIVRADNADIALAKAHDECRRLNVSLYAGGFTQVRGEKVSDSEFFERVYTVRWTPL